MADAPRTVPSRTASSNAAGELLQDYQVMHGRIPNRCERHACIERDKASLMLNGQGKEVDVRKLPRPVDSRRVENVRIQ